MAGVQIPVWLYHRTSEVKRGCGSAERPRHRTRGRGSPFCHPHPIDFVGRPPELCDSPAEGAGPTDRGGCGVRQLVIDNPVINSAFAEPGKHFKFTDDGITDEIVAARTSLMSSFSGRRPPVHTVPEGAPRSLSDEGDRKESRGRGFCAAGVLRTRIPLDFTGPVVQPDRNLDSSHDLDDGFLRGPTSPLFLALLQPHVAGQEKGGWWAPGGIRRPNHGWSPDSCLVVPPDQ